MTTEEKFDRLTERLDAIARNLELLSGMQIESERRLQQFISEVNSGLTRFARILDNHEDRIEGLEGDRPQ